MQILIPMAGEGSRFSKAGYVLPKPLIDVAGKPMIQRVIENLPFPDAHFVFLVRQEHIEDSLPILERATGGNCSIVPVCGLTEGAACTALLARDFIDTDEDLLVSNSDDLIEFNILSFLKMRNNYNGVIFTFRANDPKWSFVRLDTQGFVVEVAEKRPISDIATCGKYWFSSGRLFLSAADKMIEKNIRTNNEFYIAPVYNEILGGRIVSFSVDKMHGLGTPEDLNAYLNRTSG